MKCGKLKDFVIRCFRKLIMKNNSLLYRINGNSITCNVCGMTSYNPNDIKYKYCGNCHEFLEEIKIGGLE